MDDDNRVLGALAAVIAAATALFALCCTELAFTGGTVPLFGWEMAGNFGDGLFWLLAIDPVVVTGAYWISFALLLLLGLPLGAIVRRVSAVRSGARARDLTAGTG
jgi:hypothetical protein